VKSNVDIWILISLHENVGRVGTNLHLQRMQLPSINTLLSMMMHCRWILCQQTRLCCWSFYVSLILHSIYHGIVIHIVMA